MEKSYKRKLNMPPWHIPYLEKHRIYELFHELGRELVIQQPVDHVVFLKQIISKAASGRDVARVILLASSKINANEIANKIAEYTRQMVVTEHDILEFLKENDRNAVKSKKLIHCLSRLLHTKEMVEHGWILASGVRTTDEAKMIIEAGILPTHVLHLISPYQPPMNELLYCNVKKGWPEYHRVIMGIRDAFRQTLIEVFMQDKDFIEVAEECTDLIRMKKALDVPQRLRILLIGPRGCGRKTQAKLLVDRYNIVHVDFEYILCQAFISHTPLGDKLRSFKEMACFQSDLLVEIINRRILQDDCLKNGWVLTGFPYSVDDLKYLDCIDTPPNRIIFLEVDLNVCRERLIHRKVNVYTGSTTNLLESRLTAMGKIVATHPKDEKDIVNAELIYYCEQYASLRSYCGRTASLANADQSSRWVFECITSVLDRMPHPCPPRDPYDLPKKPKPTLEATCYCTDLALCNHPRRQS